MNLTLAHLGGLAQIFSEDSLAISNPFCQKLGILNLGEDSQLSDDTSRGDFVSSSANGTFDFKKPSFSILFAEDNFEIYVFNDNLQSDLFAARFYIPPRV